MSSHFRSPCSRTRLIKRLITPSRLYQTLSEPQSRFGDDLLGIRANLSPKRDYRSKSFKIPGTIYTPLRGELPIFNVDFLQTTKGGAHNEKENGALGKNLRV